MLRVSSQKGLTRPTCNQLADQQALAWQVSPPRMNIMNLAKRRNLIPIVLTLLISQTELGPISK